MDKNQFIKVEKQRVKKLFSKKHKQGFEDKNDFADWFIEKMIEQDYKCYYCETSIFDLIKLIENDKLKTRKTGHGTRGCKLEIDKEINENGYYRNNCVLSCYYCNKDKSYIFEAHYWLFYQYIHSILTLFKQRDNQ